MKFLNSVNDTKEEYIAQIKSAIKHANLTQYQKLVNKNPSYIFAIRKNIARRPSYQEIADTQWDHMQFLAMQASNMLFFKQAYEFLLSIGFEPNGLERKHNANKESVIDLIMTNGKEKNFNEGSLEYLFSTKLLFDYEHNYSSYPHKLSFLASLKHLKIISEQSYFNLYDKFFDSSFYRSFPIFSNFTKEEIKSFNLLQTVRFQDVDIDTCWIYKKNLNELGIFLCNRKSKQVKKFLHHFCFESKMINAMDKMSRFLTAIKDLNDQLFYWALDLSQRNLEHASINNIVKLISNFELFDHAKNTTVTIKRIEKLFNLNRYNPSDEIIDPDRVIIPIDDDDRSSDFVAEDLDDIYEMTDEATINDTVTLMKKAKSHNIVYNIKDFSSGGELHDFLSQEIDTINSVNHDLRQEEILKLDKRKFLEYTITVPKQSHDLKIVGRMLNICVGTASYDIKILRKKSNVIFLMKDKKVWACVEFANGQILQMKHKNNVDVEESVQKKFALLIRTLYGKGDLQFLDPENAIKVEDDSYLNNLYDWD